MSLYRKLYAVMEEVDRIGKDKRNEQGNYRYASEHVIKETFHPLFVKHKLLLLPIAQRLLEITPAAQGKSMAMTTIQCTYKVVDIETGEFEVLQIVGSGSDSTDKGAYKANTGALKYMLTTMFIIPTGDDPEGEGGPPTQRKTPQPRQSSKQDPSAFITEAQQKRIYALAAKVEMPVDRAKAIIGGYGYGTSKEIQVKDYAAICAEIDPSTKTE